MRHEKTIIISNLTSFDTLCTVHTHISPQLSTVTREREKSIFRACAGKLWAETKSLAKAKSRPQILFWLLLASKSRQNCQLFFCFALLAAVRSSQDFQKVQFWTLWSHWIPTRLGGNFACLAQIIREESVTTRDLSSGIMRKSSLELTSSWSFSDDSAISRNLRLLGFNQ